MCVSEKRTQHDDNDDGDDDAVLLKLLLPHVSSFILHHMVKLLFPSQWLVPFTLPFSSSPFETHNLQVHKGDLLFRI